MKYVYDTMYHPVSVDDQLFYSWLIICKIISFMNLSSAQSNLKHNMHRTGLILGIKGLHKIN